MTDKRRTAVRSQSGCKVKRLDERGSHWSSLLVEGRRPLVMILQYRTYQQGILLTVVAEYHSSERDVSIEVVEGLWEGEVPWPNKAHLQEQE